jgi:hypothetical protein
LFIDFCHLGPLETFRNPFHQCSHLRHGPHLKPGPRVSHMSKMVYLEPSLRKHLGIESRDTRIPLTQFHSHAGRPSFPVRTCQTFCSALGGCFASVRFSPGRDHLMFLLHASHIQSTAEQSLHTVRPLNGCITRIQGCPWWQVPYSGNSLSVGLTYHIRYLEVGIILKSQV